jgi:hypothetical protein
MVSYEGRGLHGRYFYKSLAEDKVLLSFPACFTGGEIWGEGVNEPVVQKIKDFKIVVFYLGRG